MKLWLLRPIEDLPEDNNPWEPWYDKSFGFVIRAKDEESAAEIAYANSGCETDRIKDAWSNSLYSTCIELNSNGKEEMIINDHSRG